jgi:hypothetical protein
MGEIVKHEIDVPRGRRARDGVVHKDIDKRRGRVNADPGGDQLD